LYKKSRSLRTPVVVSLNSMPHGDYEILIKSEHQ